ncbi:MAG: winged helix-turn-helix transcriptional regulator, partial [Lachnospiraceae bacterium]|nr:winged helix-turn-helix transcriptional regulator [Lachnospiraceae bacterium]
MRVDITAVMRGSSQRSLPYFFIFSADASFDMPEQDQVSARELTEQLHVVPGRMTDILNSLENKGCIKREKDEEDLRRLRVCITEKGRQEEDKKRKFIKEEYQGMYEILGKEDTEELIRLLKIVLTYPENK